MARDQGYLVSYISKLTEYCDVLVIKGCYLIGMDDIVRNINKADINYINLASPITNADIKDNPEEFINSLDVDKINVISNIQYAPEIIPFIRNRYSNNKKVGSFEKLKIVFATCAEIDSLNMIQEILAEKFFETKLYTSSLAEIKNYTKNVMDKLYSSELKEGIYAKFNVFDAMKQASFPGLANTQIPSDFFDHLLNLIITENFSFLYKLNSPSKSIRVMETIAKYIGRKLNHKRIANEIRLDDITYPNYYNAILNSFLGFEINEFPEYIYKQEFQGLQSWELNNDYDEDDDSLGYEVPEETTSKFYFIDANMLAYLLRKRIEPKLFGEFIPFNQIYQNFVIAELTKNLSANPGAKLYYFHKEKLDFELILTMENSKCIAFKIRSTPTVVENDIEQFEKLKELLGDKFYRGFIIYLGNELLQLTEKVYSLPLNFLWSSEISLIEREPEIQEDTISEPNNF